MIGDSTSAVVYVGNAIIDEDAQRARLIQTASHAKADTKRLLSKFEEAERLESSAELGAIAEIVADYLTLLYEKAPKVESRHHWLVSAMKRYAEKAYSEPITLAELGATYRKNAKYLGRLFKEEMKMSYSDYVLSIRLDHAKKMLVTTDSKIIEIALASGFNNVSYFNRVFFQKNGISPGGFRKLQSTK